jgi:RNA polymerase sigma-70 factor (ECF subfamily)
MAFLVLLERLTPIERAVFLLREVFDYEYSDIAAMLGQTEANCRQILRRARQHVSTMQSRFEAPQAKQDELLRVFLDAVDAGNPEGVAAFLAEDVVLHSDGGGKAAATPNAIHGSDKVARGMLGGIKRFVPAGLIRRLTWINGAPGLINYLDGKPHSVLTFDVAEGRIQSIYIISNPDKLSRLPNLA